MRQVLFLNNAGAGLASKNLLLITGVDLFHEVVLLKNKLMFLQNKQLFITKMALFHRIDQFLQKPLFLLINRIQLFFKEILSEY